jgi:hypothetical protein
MKLETGWHRIPHQKYHSELEGVGSTTLKHFLRSAAHGKIEMNKPDEQELRLGSVIHIAVLEPEEFKVLPIEPPGDGRTKAVQAARAAFYETLAGKPYAKASDVRIAKEIAAVFEEHPTWNKLCSFEGDNETTGVYDDGSGVILKIKPDRRSVPMKLLIDLKSTDDARFEKFQWQVKSEQYDAQAAYYLDTANKISPGAFEKVLWVVVETKAPYGICFYDVHETYLEKGREKYSKALATYADAKHTGKYPGYSNDIVVAVAPPF